MTRWIRVAALGECPVGQLKGVMAEGIPVVLAIHFLQRHDIRTLDFRGDPVRVNAVVLPLAVLDVVGNDLHRGYAARRSLMTVTRCMRR